MTGEKKTDFERIVDLMAGNEDEELRLKLGFPNSRVSQVAEGLQTVARNCMNIDPARILKEIVEDDEKRGLPE